LLLNTRGDRHDNKWQIRYAYSAALQTYPGYGDENKLTHDLGGQFGVRLWPWLHISTRASANLKLYLENGTDYGTTSGTLVASVSLPHRVLMNFAVETGQLDYAAIDQYDFTLNGFELTLHRSLSPNSSLEAEVNRRYLDYARKASANENQHDVMTTVRVTMTRGRKVLTQIAIEAQTNRSNNFCFDFDRLRIHGLLGFRPARRWLLRAAGMFQHKNYREPQPPACLIDLDTEREQSNFLAADLSRDLTPEISLIVRLAFYDNESTVRGRFYRKMLYFTGLEIRL
jgi:hypothetical protein